MTSETQTQLAPGVRVLLAGIGCGHITKLSDDGLWWHVEFDGTVEEWTAGAHLRRHGPDIPQVFSLPPPLDRLPLHAFALDSGHG